MAINQWNFVPNATEARHWEGAVPGAAVHGKTTVRVFTVLGG